MSSRCPLSFLDYRCSPGPKPKSLEIPLLNDDFLSPIRGSPAALRATVGGSVSAVARAPMSFGAGWRRNGSRKSEAAWEGREVGWHDERAEQTANGGSHRTGRGGGGAGQDLSQPRR